MRINYDLTPALADTAVALGSFDGLHVGHQKVIGSAVGSEKRWAFARGSYLCAQPAR